MKSFSALMLGLIVPLLCSCASSNKQTINPPKAVSSPLSLPGSEWVLVDVAGTAALPGGRATLVFTDAGSVAGNGSCNRFTGTVVVSGEALKVGPLASTRMACVDSDVSKQEGTYLRALGAATRYAYQDPYLLIYAEGFDKPLRFTRAASGRP